MSLSVSLMAAMAAIMAWVIQTENGGILNVFFKYAGQTAGGDPIFDSIANVKESVVDYAMKMLTLKPLPLGVLKYLPESVGGGQAAVDFAHAHPNREADVFWLTVSMFLLVVVLIIFIQIINCCCCCFRSPVG